MRVLVVEDEALIRLLVCDLLDEAGFACADAADAAEALALLDAGLCRAEVLVTDYNLRPGLDGKALAREALRRLPGLASAYVTGNPECFGDRPLEPSERLVAEPFSGDHVIAAVRAIGPSDRCRGAHASPERDAVRATTALEFASWMGAHCPARTGTSEARRRGIARVAGPPSTSASRPRTSSQSNGLPRRAVGPPSPRRSASGARG